MFNEDENTNSFRAYDWVFFFYHYKIAFGIFIEKFCFFCTFTFLYFF